MAASTNDYFMSVGVPGTATTLSAPGHSIAGTSINVVSTSNWPTTTGAPFAMDQFDVSTGLRVPGSYTEWTGTVVSATQITNMVLRTGTDQAYIAGSTARVYVPVSSTVINQMGAGILVDHSQAGAHEIAINYDPSNPTLETQKWAGVASAVNELTVTNAAAGSGPTLSATGGDTNIDMNVTPKGTGLFKLPAGKTAGLVRSRQGGASGDASWRTAGTTTTDTSAKATFFQAGTIAVTAVDFAVTFPTAFTQIPIVVANAVTAGNNTFAIINGTSATGFNIRLINDAGVGTTGETANWIAVGQ